MKCMVPGCNDQRHGHGHCKHHYEQVRRHGAVTDAPLLPYWPPEWMDRAMCRQDPDPERWFPLDDDEEEPVWRDLALCPETDPEVFFPAKGASQKEAKTVCCGCPVRAECLEYALEHDERFGIWGGLNTRERQRLKRGAAA